MNPKTRLWAMQNEDGNPNLVIIDPKNQTQKMYKFGPLPPPYKPPYRNLDPSMIFNAFGDLILDSQADAELIVVHHPGFEDQSVYHLPITQNGSPVQIDDTVFAIASHGVILVSDRDGETVYAIARNIFSRGAAYSATTTSVALWIWRPASSLTS